MFATDRGPALRPTQMTRLRFFGNIAGERVPLFEVLAEGMTLKIANYWLCGCGPRIMAEDFYTTNFAEENLALSIPEMLVTTILSSVLARVLGRDVARR